MENLKKLIVSPEYPEGILIDLTSEEISKKQIEEQQAEADKIAREEKIATELANKKSALNKLKALGLNDAEIKSIIG
jgi:hypothetical protein